MSFQREIIKATKFKKEAEEFNSRQDFLAALIRALEKLGPDEFDALSDETVGWYNAGVEAINNKDTIQEIPGHEEIPGHTQHKPIYNPVIPPADDEGNGEVEAEAVKEKKPQNVARVTNGALEKDRFGVTLGTKTHEAVEMYAAGDGATLREVEDRMNGVRYYNVLKKLQGRGHHVVKDPQTHKYKVIHKDDYGKQAKGA